MHGFITTRIGKFADYGIVWTIIDIVATAAVFFQILDLQKSLPDAGRYADLTEGDRQLLAELSLQLIMMILHHICIPVGLGLRKSSLVQKVDVWLHQLYVDNDSDLFDKFLAAIVQLVTDLGTEAGITTVSNMSDALLKHVQRLEFQIPDDGLSVPDFNPGWSITSGAAANKCSWRAWCKPHLPQHRQGTDSGNGRVP